MNTKVVKKRSVMRTEARADESDEAGESQMEHEVLQMNAGMVVESDGRDDRRETRRHPSFSFPLVAAS